MNDALSMASESRLIRSHLFIGGTDAYAACRSPSLVVSANGVLLAFCEGRKHSACNYGEIAILLRRSADGGRTWSDAQIVAADSEVTCSSPAAVLDGASGVVFLVFCKNHATSRESLILEGKAAREVWLTKSADDGLMWSRPEEITNSVKNPNWTWYVTGPGHGIQLKSGRLIVPCHHAVGVRHNRQDPQRVHMVFSDDHGATWSAGGSAMDGTRHASIVQTVAGAIYMNCRAGEGVFHRASAWSFDNGRTFGMCKAEKTLPVPAQGVGCSASVARLTAVDSDEKPRVLLAHPSSRERPENMAVSVSHDECRTWNEGSIVQRGPSADCDLAVLPDRSVCCFFENGEHEPFERLTAARFDVGWLPNGDGQPA